MATTEGLSLEQLLQGSYNGHFVAELSFFRFFEDKLSLCTSRTISQTAYDRLLDHASREQDFVYLGSSGAGEGRGTHAAFSARATESIVLRQPSSGVTNTSELADRMETFVDGASGTEASDTMGLPGGWIGFLGYEFGYETEARLSGLQRAEQAPLPYISAGLYHWMVSYDRKKDGYFIWIHQDCPTETRDRIDQWLSEPTDHAYSIFQMKSGFKPRQTRQAFIESVDKVRRYIIAGDCYQANLSQEFSGSFSGNLWQAFQALSDANPTPHAAFLKSEGGSVLSISPERFLKIQKGIVSTSPIKGTRKRGLTPEEDQKLASELEASEKDRAENLMIVDLLRNDLSRNALPGSVRVDKLFELESYRNVHHLVSHIQCQLNENVSPMKALFDAFPGGSITGAPKIRAMEIIRELEPHSRGPYCGSVFHRRFDGSLESNIAIRTLYSDDDETLYCCGGGGIVADSDPASEYEETLTKVKPLMDFLESLGPSR